MRQTVYALLAKELRLELRTPQVVPAMTLFSITTFVVFHFALQRDNIEGSLAAGVLTTTLLLAAMLGIGRLFTADYEEGGFDGFLLAPVERTALLISKAASLMLFLVLVEIVAIPAFSLLLLGPSISWTLIAHTALTVILVDFGIAVIGTLVGALAVQTRARDLLVPLIALPLLLPVVIGAATLLADCFAAGGPEPLASRWLLVICLYDLVFALLAYALFEFLLDD